MSHCFFCFFPPRIEWQQGAGMNTQLPRCDRTDVGDGRGEGTEADHGGCFEFYSSQRLRRLSLTGVHFPVGVQTQRKVWGAVVLEMNLYRSFGNLMEAWVTERGHSPDSEWLGNNDEDPSTPSSDTGTNLRSESVDSGVETASSDTSFLAASFSTSTDRAELDTFMPEGGGLTPASASHSPVLSSPPPSSSALHQKVEQALQRTDSKHLKDNPEPLTVEAVLRRRPRASFQPRRHTSDLVRGQRPESFGLWTTLNPAEPMRLTRRRPASMICDRQPVRKRLEVRCVYVTNQTMLKYLRI